MEKKLYRDEHRKVIAGVCAGLADYFNVDVSIVRLILVLSLILKGGGGLIYIVLWIVLPKKDYTIIPPVDYTVPPGAGYQQPYNAYQNPVPPVMPYGNKKPTTAALIGGLVLIILGAGLLVDQFDLIPDLHFEQWWPVILVVIGLVLIVNRNNHRTAAAQWQQPEIKKDVNENTSDETPKTEL